MNPGQAIFDPGVIAWRDARGLVETANGDIDFIGIWLRQKRQWCAAFLAKRTQTGGPIELPRFSGGETKSVAAECSPGHERGAVTATAVQAMAVRDIVWLAGRLIAHRTAQTTAADNVCVHCLQWMAE